MCGGREFPIFDMMVMEEGLILKVTCEKIAKEMECIS